MDDSVNELIYFLVWPLPETAMGSLCSCLVGVPPYTHYQVRDTTTPLCAKGSSRTKNYVTRPPGVVTAEKQQQQQQQQNSTLTVYVAHVVTGVFYSVVANRRQPNLYMEGGVLLYSSP